MIPKFVNNLNPDLQLNAVFIKAFHAHVYDVKIIDNRSHVIMIALCRMMLEDN